MKATYCKAKVGACCHPSCTCGIKAKRPVIPEHFFRVVNEAARMFDLLNGTHAMNPEQQKLHEQLAAEYGERILLQARELSGLTACMVALGRDDLNEAERKRMYDQASLHLGQLLETMMPPAISEKVTECAKRLDEAIALWAADEVERRDGLPG